MRRWPTWASARPLALLAALLATALANGCGYHLAGHGGGRDGGRGGAVPADVRTVAVSAPDASLARAFRQWAREHASGWTMADDAASADAELRISAVSEQFTPTAFDANGVAVTYRLSRAAELSLWRNGKRLWRSGPVTVSGDVYAVGGPASIDASRARVRRDLEREWLREAWQRLISGF